MSRNLKNRNLLKELEAIERLPVLHRIQISRYWYESYFEESIMEWWERNIQHKNFGYYFLVEKGVCKITVVYHMVGEMVLESSTASTTESAIRKTIAKFYRKYDHYPKNLEKS